MATVTPARWAAIAAELPARAAQLAAANPTLRPGQAYWNALEELDPLAAKELTASDWDTYYDSDRIPALMGEIHWRAAH